MTKKTKEEKEKLSVSVTKKLKELNELDTVGDLIKDNKIEFTHKEKKYRVRKPNLKEKNNIRNKTNKKYIELLDNDDFILREQLIVKLKKNGVDVDNMERKIKGLQSEIENVQVKLAQISDKKTVDILKKDIEDLMREQQLITIDIKEYLEPCIETELAEFGNLYMIYSLLEKEVNIMVYNAETGEKGKLTGTKWIKVFNSYDEFLNTEEDDLISKSAYYLSLIIFNRGLERDSK